MSAIVYSEPHKLPAGVLAVAVHGALFALLYFGIHWQAQPPQGMVVDIWESLPEVGGWRLFLSLFLSLLSVFGWRPVLDSKNPRRR